MYRGIKNLYLIKGKIVFRAHIRKNGEEKHIWKVLGKPGDFTDEELKRKVEELLREIWTQDESCNQPVESEAIFSSLIQAIQLLPGNKFTHLLTATISSILQAINQLFPVNKSAHLLTATEKQKETNLTLGNLLTKFLAWYKEERAYSSYVRYRRRARKILEFFGENTPVNKITLEKIEEYKKWRRKQGVKPVTINKDLRLLATAINRAVEFEWIPNHKLYRKPFLIKGVKSERIRYLTEDEEKKLIQALDQSRSSILKDVVLFALHTGLRLGEILNLKWENVNLKDRVIILFPEQTKSRRKHVLPLNDVAFEVLKRRFECRIDSCPYVFHRQGRKVKSIREAFENALKRAGIENFRFHDLRHTFASRLVQKGVDLYVVKELLNHSDIQTTQRYAHLKLDNLKSAVEILEQKKSLKRFKTDRVVKITAS